MVKNSNPKNLNATQLRTIFKKIITRIKEKPVGFFKFKKMRAIRGLWCSGDEILIDHRREIVPTIIHEMLHDLYEENEENWVMRVESKISQIIKPKDVHVLLVEFFSKMKLNKK